MADEAHSSDHSQEGEGPKKFEIKIDRGDYTVTQPRMSGEQIRHVSPTPIPADRDLFLVIPGSTDEKILDDMEVEMKNGMRFFTAPAQINPGS